MSVLFDLILREVCMGNVQEPFRAIDFPVILERSKSFLWGHAIEEGKPKPPKGKPYFIRYGWGRYRINPAFRKC